MKDNKPKSDSSLNLPVLRKVNEGLSKKSEIKKLKTFDTNLAKKHNEVNDILKTDLIKKQMHNEQQARCGLDLVLMGDLTGSMRAYHTILKTKFKEICCTLYQLIPNMKLKLGILVIVFHD